MLSLDKFYPQTCPQKKGVYIVSAFGANNIFSPSKSVAITA